MSERWESRTHNKIAAGQQGNVLPGLDRASQGIRNHMCVFHRAHVIHGSAWGVRAFRH